MQIARFVIYTRMLTDKGIPKEETLPERWNGYEESDENSENSFDIRLNFENGKEFFMRGSLLPEGFEAFQEEFIEETMLFYNEQTGKRNDK